MAHDYRPNLHDPAGAPGTAGAPAESPGKRTLTGVAAGSTPPTDPGSADAASRLPRLDLPAVQRRADGGGAPSDPAQVTAIAEGGVASGGGALPHRDSLEAGFGVDLSDVRAHTGSSAAQASRAIGAEAYTMGS